MNQKQHIQSIERRQQSVLEPRGRATVSSEFQNSSVALGLKQNLPFQLLNDESNIENVWKMYNRARESLPYKRRMENFTWRMMFINNRAKPIKREPDEPLHNESPMMDPSADDFDYVAHIRKMGGHRNNVTDNPKKRPAEFSPIIRPNVPDKHMPQPFLQSQSGHYQQNQEMSSGFEFTLDPLAFEGPNNNFNDGNNEQSYYQQYLNENFNFSNQQQTIGPSIILNQFGNRPSQRSSSISNGSNNTTPTAQFPRNDDSLISLPDYQSNGVNVPVGRRPTIERSVSQTPHLPYSNSFISDGYPQFHSSSLPGQSPTMGSGHSGRLSHFTDFNENPSYFEPYQRNLNEDNVLQEVSDKLQHSLPSSTKLAASSGVSKPSVKKAKPTKLSKKKGGSPTPKPEASGFTGPNGSTASVSCTNCHTKTTPLWRRNPQGQPLCNACGLFLKLHGVVRPLSLKTDVIKKRQRGNTSNSKKSSGFGGSSVSVSSAFANASNGTNSNGAIDGDDLNPTSLNKIDTKLINSIALSSPSSRINSISNIPVLPSSNKNLARPTTSRSVLDKKSNMFLDNGHGFYFGQNSAPSRSQVVKHEDDFMNVLNSVGGGHEEEEEEEDDDDDDDYDDDNMEEGFPDGDDLHSRLPHTAKVERPNGHGNNWDWLSMAL